MEGIIITFTQSSDIYNMQLACNRALNILALNILKYLLEDNLHKKLNFLSIKSNDTILDYGPYEKYDNPILAKGLPKLLVLNVCSDIGSCGMANVNSSLLPFQYKTVDDGSMEKGVNNSQDKIVTFTTLNESYKWSSVENTSSRDQKLYCMNHLY